MQMEVIKNMSNVIDFNSKQPHQLQLSQVDNTNYDRAVFVVGAFVTIVLPTVTYCAFRGPVPFAVFAGVALIGTLLGVANYFLVSYKRSSSIYQGPGRFSSANTTAQAPAESTTKKAA